MLKMKIPKIPKVPKIPKIPTKIWLLWGHTDIAEIKVRQDAVEYMIKDDSLCGELRKFLVGLPDLER